METEEETEQREGEGKRRGRNKKPGVRPLSRRTVKRQTDKSSPRIVKSHF